MAVRPFAPDDLAQLQVLASKLWPDDDPYMPSTEQVFVWEAESGALGGFACVSVRLFVDGAHHSPCPHIEGWYVEPDLRGQGVGKQLVVAIEAWCVSEGFRELTSDTWTWNTDSIEAHKALGFELTDEVQFFRKGLQ